MTDKIKPGSHEERRAAQQAQEDTFRAALAVLQFDGPFDFPAGGFDVFSALAFGGWAPRSKFAICLRCGACVVLADAEELPDGKQMERGVRLHTAWHEDLGR